MERTSPRVVRSATFAELRPDALYGILQLRSEVFVVEQQCVYLDADGRDAVPSTSHWWIEDGGVVVACARLLRETDDEGAASTVGRVVTKATHRSQGLAGLVIDAALAVAPRPVTIHAQAHLEGWYARRFGFVREGGFHSFLEDGIPHVLMVIR